MVSRVLMKMGVVLLILINEIPILSQKKKKNNRPDQNINVAAPPRSTTAAKP